MKRIPGILLLPAGLLIATPVAASGGGDTAFVLNTLFVLACGVLVMFMAAGFAMLEAGAVRSKSVAVICTKNIALYAVAGTLFYLLGYELMYGGSVSGLMGNPASWAPDDTAALNGDTRAGIASGATWFFQMVFVATAASVVSGALAERVKFWPFVAFVVLLSGFIYPLTGHWTWGGGWLAELGFTDFAGSTIVHSVGGWAALAGAILLGSRSGRFAITGEAISIPPSSLPLVTLGTFILWFGWFGFNGGSQLAFAGVSDAVAVATILVNTNIAAAGGVVTMMCVTQYLYRRLDLPLILNGALAGLVSITADPVSASPEQALVIGALGSVCMLAGCRLLERLRIDDVVGAVPVHLCAGIWGTLAVAVTNPASSLLVQLAGIASIGAFVFAVSFAAWLVFRLLWGIRLHPEAETDGGDLIEVGIRAYNLS